MADESNEQARTEGAGETISNPELPVNLAAVQAAKRVVDSKSERAESSAAETPVDPAAAVDSAENVEVQASAPAPLAPPADPATATVELAELAEAATKGRLSPADEERATSHMRVCISHDAEGMSAALAAMGKLPWILGVRAVEQSWATLPVETRTALLVRLTQERWGDFIRLRLSLARSLVKVDPPVGLHLAAEACKSVWMEEKGMLTPADSKLIGNVFIGRGKPWALQLALEGLSEEDARAIVSCVAYSAFNVNNPPITQLSVLRYAGARLGQLHENIIAMVAKSVSRWSGKWKVSLQSEVPELPEAITAALAGAQENEPEQERQQGEESALPPELEEKLKAAIETGERGVIDAVTEEVNQWRESQRAAAEEERSSRGRRGQRGKRDRGNERNERGGERNDRGSERERDREGDRDRGRGKKERPQYVSREEEAAAKSGGGPFNLVQSLRQIENHVQQLRGELVATQGKLRKAEVSGPRRATSGGLQNLSAEELSRVVLQLEGRNAELQSRVEDLLADSEARALATAADADITVQYRTLLKLKLQEFYVDYLALETGTPDVVVKQHYRTLIRQIFSVLREENVALDGDLPPPPPEPMPPFPPAPEVDDIEEDDEELDQIDLTPPEMPTEEELIPEEIEETEEDEESEDEDEDREEEDEDEESEDERGEEEEEEPEAESEEEPEKPERK